MNKEWKNMLAFMGILVILCLGIIFFKDNMVHWIIFFSQKNIVNLIDIIVYVIVALIFAVFLSIPIIIFLFIDRKMSDLILGKNKPIKKINPKLVGFHGWLLFFMITLWLGVILSFSNIFYYIDIYLDLSLNPEVSEQVLNGLLSFIWISLIYFPLLIYTLILALRHKRKFVGWMISLLWISFLISWYLITIFKGDIDYPSFKLIISFISAMVWSLYLINSQRVKNTFTK